MIRRRLFHKVEKALARQAAVVLLGPRQVGKTTLALAITENREAVYLDLENPRDRQKLSEPELFLSEHADKLVILDEIHRVPEIFQILRGVIDQGRREGNGTGRFLLLGSASMDLLQQSGETLAGRISYIDLSPFDVLEVDAQKADQLWLRGGFPDSFLSLDEADSFAWREDMIRTYLEREIPMFGPRIPAETLRRFWTMLAHNQSSPLNASRLASGLGVSSPTVNRYTDLLVDLLLVKRLMPYYSNVGKRLFKSPKIYIRDSGLVHALLGISDRDTLLGHPVVGSSWEGFVIDNLINAAPDRAIPSYYRTSGGAEIDLLLELPRGELWAIEIKRSLNPKLKKGFHSACEDLKPSQRFVVYPGQDRYPIATNIDVISLNELAARLVTL